MKEYNQGLFTGERALYHLENANIINSVFQDGESPLKESKNIHIDGSIFRWKYPLWYANQITVENTTLLETARSGIWYTNYIEMNNCMIEAPKTFRRGHHITLTNCILPLAQETFWNCSDIVLKNVTARGDYFGMNAQNVEIDHFNLTGNYCFDGAKNIVVRNSRLISKDSFWNTENVEIYDSYIVGEYLAWNSKNIKFVNCTIESNQGLNYMDNVEMINCTLIHTDLAFEFVSNLNAKINSHIDSVKNPISGQLECESIGELIMDPDLINPEQTDIRAKHIEKRSDKGEERR
ncbi:MAG: DUF3737 family protein [Firmicutes bacterium]|nr:DUF3737 family protein [Bacillota bacterium]